MVDHVKEIRSALMGDYVKPPFYASTLTISKKNLLTKFFFSKDGDAHCVDLVNLSDHDIQLLSDACDPATFGLDKKDVLDPSYRKALKMDKSNFSTNFELKQKEGHMDIISEIKTQLWDAPDGGKIIHPEIYKLNVYGKDSFFKKHKDTPRGVDMVGSLVVAFPTPECEGGQLVLSKDDESWTWDSANILKEAPERTIAYVAFYSDTDHEVLPVTKGNRITITYNLYVESENNDDFLPEEEEFMNALSKALQDPDFLPKGGYLAFGLNYMYPVDPMETELYTLMNSLKGSDAMTKRVCKRLGLEVKLKAVYRDGDEDYGDKEFYVLDTILTPDELDEQEENYIRTVEGTKKLVMISADGEVIRGRHDPYRESCYAWPENYIPVLWINEQVRTEFKTMHICYGNEATLGYIYAYICLMAKVEVPGNRGKVIPQKRRKLD